MTHRERILSLLAVKSFTQKQLLVGYPHRLDRDEIVDAINELRVDDWKQVLRAHPAHARQVLRQRSPARPRASVNSPSSPASARSTCRASCTGSRSAGAF